MAGIAVKPAAAAVAAAAAAAAGESVDPALRADDWGALPRTARRALARAWFGATDATKWVIWHSSVRKTGKERRIVRRPPLGTKVERRTANETVEGEWSDV